MTRHDDVLLEAIAALPRVEPNTAHEDRLRARCHARLEKRPRSKAFQPRALFTRRVKAAGEWARGDV